MEEIKAYQLSDGSIVKDKKEATTKQIELDFKSELYEFSELNGCYEGKNDIYRSINENREKVFEMLKKVLNK